MRGRFFGLCVMWLSLWACTSVENRAPAEAPVAVPAYLPEDLIFTWEGVVDGIDWLKFHGDRYWIEHVAHLPIRQIKFDLDRSLDASVFPVLLVKERGRGEISIIRQGEALNGYTLIVEVNDGFPAGADTYRFSVYHDRLTPDSTRRIFQLNAVVDETTTVTIQGEKVIVETLSGEPVSEMKYFFERGEQLASRQRYELLILWAEGQAELEQRTEGSPSLVITMEPDRQLAVFNLAVTGTDK